MLGEAKIQSPIFFARFAREIITLKYTEDIACITYVDLGQSYSLWCSVVRGNYVVSGAPRVNQRQGPCAGKRRP